MPSNELPISCGRGAARDHVTKATILRTEGGQLHGRVGRAGGPIASHCHTPRHVPCGAIGRVTRHPEQLPRHARQHPRHVPCVRTGRTTRHAPGLPRHVRRARTDRPGMRDHAPSSGRGLRRPTNEACSVMANRAACDDHVPTPERPTGCPSVALPPIGWECTWTAAAGQKRHDLADAQRRQLHGRVGRAGRRRA